MRELRVTKVKEGYEFEINGKKYIERLYKDIYWKLLYLEDVGELKVIVDSIKIRVI